MGRDCAFIETNLTTCLDWLRCGLNARNCFVIQMIAALPACLVDCTRRHSLCTRSLTSPDMCHCLGSFVARFYDGNKLQFAFSTKPFFLYFPTKIKATLRNALNFYWLGRFYEKCLKRRRRAPKNCIRNTVIIFKTFRHVFWWKN